jgi:hypothetical protein
VGVACYVASSIKKIKKRKLPGERPDREIIRIIVIVAAGSAAATVSARLKQHQGW